MITGFLQQWATDKHYFPTCFDKAVQFLSMPETASLVPGKYAIDGDAIFASIIEEYTAPANTRRFELHQRYIDIQVLCKGKEMHGYSPLYPRETALEDRLAKDDVAFYPTPAEANWLTLLPGQYAVYFPKELHCPLCTVGQPELVRKIVLKIAVSCIG